MLPQRPAARAGIVAAGFAAAFVVGGVMVYIRQKLTSGPDSVASSGMYAAGDMLLGLGVFGLLFPLPLGLALYWLRGVARFWTWLAWGALLFVLTSPLAAVGVSSTRDSLLPLVCLARIGVMPFTAFGFGLAGLFAPRPKPRWGLIGLAVIEGVAFLAIFFIKLLPTRG